MKIRRLLLLLLLIVTPSLTFAGGMGTYSDGYRMGQLTKFSIKGLTKWTKSGEGQLLLGNESTIAERTVKDADGNTSTVRFNPWHFSSTDKGIQKQLQQRIGDYVVVKYNQARIKNPNVDTDYEIVTVNDIGSPLKETCTAKKYDTGGKSQGKRVGRIVKASRKGHVGKSWEILIQQGNSGSQFKAMSISDDEALYNCAVGYLKAGQKVKVSYEESFVNLDVFGRNTNYDIVKIEPVKGLN